MNKHGKCLAVETVGKSNPSENGAKIVQSTSNPTEKGQLWKYDQRKFTICNDWNKCLSLPFIYKNGKTSDLIADEQDHIWMASNTNQFIILGFCLAFEGNSDGNGVTAITNYCNESEKGQIGSFVQY